MDFLTKEQKDIMKIIGVILLVLLLIVLIGIGPLITIWSINTVFSAAIVYNFWTWLGMLYLQMITFGGVISKLHSMSNKL